MDARSWVELSTIIGGVIVSIYGALSSIRQRREQDAAIGASAGTQALATAKALQDVIRVDPTYTQQVQANLDALQTKLATAEALLRQHGIAKG